MKLSTFSIRNQLNTLVGMLLLMFLVISGVALGQLSRSNERQVQMYESRVVPMQDLKQVSDMYAVQLVDTTHKVQHGMTTWAQGLEMLRQAELNIKRSWLRYKQRELSSTEQALVTEAETLMAAGDDAIRRAKQILTRRDQGALEAFGLQELYQVVDPITQQLDRLVQLEQTQAQRHYTEAQRDYAVMQVALAGMALGFTLAGLWLAWLIVRNVRSPLQQAQEAADRIAQGNLSQAVAFEGNNEVAHLLRSLNAMQDQLRGQDDQRWVKTHASDIGTSMQLADSYTELGHVFLSKVVPLVGAGHAVFYVMNPEHRLQLLSTYGFQERKELSHLYELGQGLVGQCALERQSITLNEPPPDYVRINSGLGDGVPRCILLLPVMQREEVLGIVEIAGFHTFTSRETALLDALLPLLAMNLEILQRKMRTQRLLEQTQEQAQRMENKAAQLEEQAVEMEAQQAEQLDTEAWYRSIIESAPDGMLVVNEAGVIILCNSQIEQIFGYAQEELLGQPVEMLVPDDVRSQHPQKRERFMKAEGYRPIESGMALRGRHKNGQEFPAEFGLSMLPTRSARGRCVAVSVRDITHRQASSQAVAK